MPPGDENTEIFLAFLTEPTVIQLEWQPHLARSKCNSKVTSEISPIKETKLLMRTKAKCKQIMIATMDERKS